MRFGLVVVAVGCTLIAPTHASQNAPVWFWFATCGGPGMTLEVRFDRTIVQKASFPVCLAPRDGADSQGQSGRMAFVFTARRMVVWTGYRETSDRSRAGQALEFTVWQAGADPEALILGVSVMTADRILMNTVHIAHPDKRDESTIAAGLTIATYLTPQ